MTNTMTETANNNNNNNLEAALRWPEAPQGEDEPKEIQEAQEAFVKRMIETERPDLPKVEGVKRVGSGFSGQAFFVDMGGERRVFLRNLLPKHRAWACQRAAQKATADMEVPIACDLAFTKYDAEMGGSFELTGPACDGGEIVPIPVMQGIVDPPPDTADTSFPSPEVCRKVGAAIAKLHAVGTDWHGAFASKEAYDREIGVDISNLFLFGHNIYDDENPAMVNYRNRLLNVLVNIAQGEPKLAENGTSGSYLKSVSDQDTDHPILKASVGYERLPGQSDLEVSTADIVTSHGDVHGANILLDHGEPVIIDFETAHVGPAGWDLGNFYQCFRRQSPDHDYEQASAFARGYLQERMDQIHGSGHPKSEISDDDVDDFLFEIMCWYFIAQVKQTYCIFLTGGKPQPAAWDFAMKTLSPEYGRKFAEKMQECKTSIEARRELVRTGNLDF